MNHLQFDFETEDAQQLEQLVALLSEQGFEGFEEEGHFLKAFVPEDEFNEEQFAAVLDLFATISYIKTVVEKINWNQQWEENFTPVIIDDFVAIRAGFHQPIKTVQQEIIITPKMSFGTGHHATTHLMIRQMGGLDFNAKTVLDFGTGTGVLAILAERLGAEEVLAIDYDEWSIINAQENIEQNNCTRIELKLSDQITDIKKFDIIIANINLNVILAASEAIVNASKAGAYILLSGFLKEDEKAMLSCIESSGLIYLSTFQRGDWIMMIAQNQPVI